MQNVPRLGPLVLAPIFKERIWGAKTLPAPYPQPAEGKPVGEVWLTAEECAVASGPFAGRTLGDLAHAKLGAAHGFPLLLKLLFPCEKLSVQVHPNDEEAQGLGHRRGKTECWYVLEAKPDAQVAVGLREPMTPEEIERAIEEGSLESKMQMLSVRAGDMVFVDAGTIHAIGPGMVVLETQQYSDVTYRLFDYGRRRELHIEQGLAVTKADTAAGKVAPVDRDGFTRLLSSEYFAVDRFELSAGARAVLGEADALQILVPLADGCVLTANGVELALPQGQAVVLPAEGVSYEIVGAAGAAVMRILEP